jgi:hypothetical protein
MAKEQMVAFILSYEHGGYRRVSCFLPAGDHNTSHMPSLNPDILEKGWRVTQVHPVPAASADHAGHGFMLILERET